MENLSHSASLHAASVVPPHSGTEHLVLLERLHAAGAIDWSRASLECLRPSRDGGPATRPNPTVPGNPGTKRDLVTDARGTPLGAIPALRNARRGRPRRRPNKAYDAQARRQECWARDRAAHRSARHRAHRETRVRRWVVVWSRPCLLTPFSNALLLCCSIAAKSWSLPQLASMAAAPRALRPPNHVECAARANPAARPTSGWPASRPGRGARIRLRRNCEPNRSGRHGDGGAGLGG